MNIKISLSAVALSEVDRVVKMLGDKARPAVARAINRSIQGVPTDATREVRKTYNVRASDVRSRFYLRKASVAKLFGQAISTGKAIPLTRFSPLPGPGKRRPPVGLSFLVMRAHGRRKIPRSFWAKGSVFQRIGEDRNKIKKLFAPSVPQMVGRPEIIQQFQQQANHRFMVTFDHEVGRLFAAMGAK